MILFFICVNAALMLQMANTEGRGEREELLCPLGKLKPKVVIWGSRYVQNVVYVRLSVAAALHQH